MMEKDNKDPIVEIGNSVTEVIDFLNQLKTYTEAAVNEHDQAIHKITGAVVNEAQKLNNRVRRLARLVLILTGAVVGIFAYLCVRH